MTTDTKTSLTVADEIALKSYPDAQAVLYRDIDTGRVDWTPAYLWEYVQRRRKPLKWCTVNEAIAFKQLAI